MQQRDAPAEPSPPPKYITVCAECMD